MKKLLPLILALALVFSLCACGAKTPTTSTPPVEPSKAPTSEAVAVGMSVSTLNNPFFVTLTDGAKAKATEMNVTLTVVDAGDDAAKQANDIDDLIAKKIAVLIVNPVDSDAIAPAVKAAKAAGIKVIAVDRAVNGETVDCQIASDNVMGAKLAGEYLLELVGEKAKVAELEGVPGASAAVDRGKGFHLAVDGKLDVVATQTANFNREEGLTVTENILQANGDIKGIFAHNDEMALGAVEAVASAKKDVIIIGFDATDDAKAAVEAGTMAATVAQQPDLMGATAVEVAVKLAKGEKVEASMPVEVTLIKK
ncbi:MAG: substrate-binding domain-containing protein [Oscillospiraceae bacterium]